MNPFDQPPTGGPVSFEAPVSPTAAPRRGRMALVAVLTAGLIGVGIAGLSEFAEADRPDVAAPATDDTTDDTLPPVDDTVAPRDDRDDSDDDAPPAPAGPDLDGEITIDLGGDAPIVFDLDEFDDDTVARLTECIGIPAFDFSFDIGEWEPGEGPFGDRPLFDLDELFDGEGELAELFDDFSFDFDIERDLDGDFGVFDTDGNVTITGPDGVSVVDLGENGSVTVTKDGDDLTITTDGDATVSELTDLFGEFGSVFESMPFDDMFDDEAFDEFLETLPNPEDFGEIEPIDPDAVQSCLDEVLGR